MFQPQPRIETLPIGDEGQCLIIDDALCDPQALVEHALRHRAGFEMSGHNAFPGPELRMPEAFTAELDAWFAQHLRSGLGVRRTLRRYSRLSMVTLQPAQLAPRQWLCHRDRMDAVPGERIVACVIYLFHDPLLGGTNFFRPSLDPERTARLVHESGNMPASEFSARWAIEPGYMTRSGPCFEKLASVPARWNRMIFYDGMQFHCSDIRDAARLRADPRAGRLTLNGFFTCSSRLTPIPCR